MLGVVARIEASIDFPEEDVPTPVTEELHPLIIEAQQRVDALLAGSERGRLYRQGLRTAIIGRPNVGKSSLLNALLRTERAIVTSIAGTTRDTVEEVANLRGIPLHLIDTAGITPSDDPVEQIGVQRSRAAAETADIVLLVFDGSEPLTEQDRRVSSELQAMGFGTASAQNAQTHRCAGDETMHPQALMRHVLADLPEQPHHRTVIVVLNKSDRERRIELNSLQQVWPNAAFIHTSTLTSDGLSELEEIIAELVLGGKVLSSESVLVTSARHQEALRRVAAHLQAAISSLERALPLDFVSIDLRAAYEGLGEVTGETTSDDLLDRIFSEFCIGK
jgi:tRNA modification GTPase